jgi:alkanesulfonate monooxygenase SsuD/methylene tetrahydromethanopterin reductase-like flavin-dependent oxidoreductase (luciferase family)
MQVWIRQGMGYKPQTKGPTPFPVPGWMWDRDLGRNLYADRMRYIHEVDRMGFDGIIFTEHHYGPNGGLTPSPHLTLAAASQVTERIKLVTMGIILAAHAHPVRVAEEVAMLDNLSNGRHVVGFISGNTQSQWAYSIPPEHARGMHEEAFALIKRAWTDENPFDWHGTYYNYDCVSILPRPLQNPHPPVWTTARAAESIEWAARNRIGLIATGAVEHARKALDYYRDYATRECGWTPTADDCGLAREFTPMPTMEEALASAEKLYVREREDAYEERFEAPQLAEFGKGRYTQRSYEYLAEGGDAEKFVQDNYMRLRRELVGRDFEELKRNGQFIVGDADAAGEQIQRQLEAVGASVMIVQPEVGSRTLDDILISLDLFSQKALPALQRE